MRGIRLGILCLAVSGALYSQQRACAQYSSIATPLHNVGASYYESLGIGFSGNIGNNVFFNNGGGPVRPPFGGGVGGGAQFGFGLRGNGGGFNFGLSADSGYDAGMTSVTPSITLPNGGTGAIFDVQQRPFVTGLVPMVGHFAPGIGYTMAPPRVTSPLAERLSRIEAAGGPAPPPSVSPSTRPSAGIFPNTRQASTAERGEQSLTEIRAAQTDKAASHTAEVEALLEAARLREAAGEIGQALIDYGRAASRLEGAEREAVRAKMRLLREQARN